MIARKIIIQILVFYCISCTPEKRYIDYQKVKKLTEDSTRTFDPTFMEQSHVAVVFKIRHYEIYDSLIHGHGLSVKATRNIEGRMPAMKSGGTFQVIFNDSSGNELYSYRMKSPLYHRVEQGSQKGLYKIQAGSFDVPVPNLPDIREIVLKDYGRTKHRSRF